MNACPHCRQPAPVVYRGLMAYCTACGAPRLPLASASVTFAGKPEKVGGTLARAFGWLVVAGGASLALLVFGLCAAFGQAAIGAAIGAPVALATGLVGWLLLRSGRDLTTSGAANERDMQLRAVMALAAHRGGSVRAEDVAEMLGVGLRAADALLTTFAKSEPDRVRVDLDDAGGVHYRVAVPADLAAEVEAAAEEATRRRAHAPR